MRATRAQAKTYQLNLSGQVEDVTTRHMSRQEEAMHQAVLMAHRSEMQEIYPNLRFLFCTLNGIFMPPHIRAKAIEAGMAKGILDLFYLAQRNGFAGLVMDLKKIKGGRASKEQLEWAEHLKQQGFLVLFPAGCVEAWRCLCCYEGIAGPDHIAPQLIARENSIRRICEVDASSEWEA